MIRFAIVFITATLVCTTLSASLSAQQTTNGTMMISKARELNAEYIAKSLDDPARVTVAGVSGGKISKAKLLESPGLKILDPFEGESVAQYLVSVEAPNGTYQAMLCKTAKFNDNIMKYLRKAKPGTKVIIENIQLKQPDGSLLDVAAIVLELSGDTEAKQ